jgi:adenylate cyclase
VYFTEATDKKLDKSLADIPENLPGIPLSHAIRFVNEGVEAEALPDYVRNHAYPVKIDGVVPRKYDTVFYPVRTIAQKAPSLHSVTYWTDRDGVSRMAEPLFQYGGDSFPLLPLRAFLYTLDPDVSLTWRKDSLLIHGSRQGKPADMQVPLENGRMRIHYYSRATYDAVARNSMIRIPVGSIIRSIWAVDKGDLAQILIQPDAFADKIVIIGVSAAGTFDEKITPHGAQPGYILHTTMLSNLLEGRFLTRTSAVSGFAAAVLLLLVTGFLVLFFHRMIVRILLPVALFVLILAVTAGAFYYNVAFYIAPVPLSFVPGFLGMLGVLTYFEGADKRRFKGAMSKYLSPDVLEEVMSKGELKAEVGHRKVLTVLFSDVRGFTTISESQDAATVVEILNEYFSAMVSLIFENKGTLDKFIGDAIMAFWGAPIPRADHAELAVKTALQMTQALRRLNETFHARGMDPLAIGIGINTGEMIVGNIGSDQRLDYTVIGDNVNLGSRLESLTKTYGVEILISDATHRIVWNKFPCRLVDHVAVKGKSIPVPVYEPLLPGMYGEMRSSDVEQAFQTAFDQFRGQNWDDAIASYRLLAEKRHGRDTVAEIMISRCEYFRSEPPPANWDGSFVMKTK